MSPRNVAIVIPSRMGSTRLPGKPLKMIAGKPLVYWVIEAALKVRNISQVILATDHVEIMKVASDLNIESIYCYMFHSFDDYLKYCYDFREDLRILKNKKLIRKFA